MASSHEKKDKGNRVGRWIEGFNIFIDTIRASGREGRFRPTPPRNKEVFLKEKCIASRKTRRRKGRKRGMNTDLVRRVG